MLLKLIPNNNSAHSVLFLYSHTFLYNVYSFGRCRRLDVIFAHCMYTHTHTLNSVAEH